MKATNLRHCFASDQLNRLTQKLYPDGSTVNYTYDNDSRLTQVTDPTGTYQFTFDNMGRLTGVTTSYAFLTGAGGRDVMCGEDFGCRMRRFCRVPQARGLSQGLGRADLPRVESYAS